MRDYKEILMEIKDACIKHFVGFSSDERIAAEITAAALVYLADSIRESKVEAGE